MKRLAGLWRYTAGRLIAGHINARRALASLARENAKDLESAEWARILGTFSQSNAPPLSDPAPPSEFVGPPSPEMTICPKCYPDDDGNGEPDCPICHGGGIVPVYLDPPATPEEITEILRKFRPPLTLPRDWKAEWESITANGGEGLREGCPPRAPLPWIDPDATPDTEHTGDLDPMGAKAPTPAPNRRPDGSLDPTCRTPPRPHREFEPLWDYFADRSKNHGQAGDAPPPSESGPSPVAFPAPHLEPLDPQPIVKRIDSGWDISGIPCFMGYAETHIATDERFGRWGFPITQRADGVWCWRVPHGATAAPRCPTTPTPSQSPTIADARQDLALTIQTALSDGGIHRDTTGYAADITAHIDSLIDAHLSARGLQ